MRKFYILFLCTLVLFLTSCKQESLNAITDSISNDEENKTDIPIEWITLSDSINFENMNLYWQSDNLYFTADENAKISLYVNAVKDDNGEFGFDDGQDWMLIMETSFGNYTLFPRKWVQLGGIYCTAFNEYNNQTEEYDIFHVLVTERQSAGYIIYDCVFDNEKKEFKRILVYNAENINYSGSSVKMF